MHRWPIFATALLCTLLLVACRKGSVQSGAPAVPAEAGCSYSLNDGEGGFRVAKVIANEDGVVFVHWFGTRWTSRPTLEQSRAAGKPTSIAFLSEAFAGMQPVKLEKATVSADELDTYERWKQSPRDVF
jgi:hypothetical protein